MPERLGHDYETAISLNPRLVYVYGGSYGFVGPWNMRPAFHSTPNALCGGGFAQAGLGNPPADDSYPDPGSGIATATAIMLGLWARRGTGRGQYVETSMISSAGYIHSDDLVLYEGRPASGVPTRASTACTLVSPLRGRRRLVFVAAWRDAEFEALARALDHPEWVDDERSPMRPRARRTTPSWSRRSATRFVTGRTVDDWVARLEAADVAAAA